MSQPAAGGARRGRRGAPRATLDAEVISQEHHPWLQWSGCNAARKTVLNTKLAALRERPILAPRQMDWDFLGRIRVDISEFYITCSVTAEVEIPMWERAWTVDEPVFREWVLEFYCSIDVQTTFVPGEFTRTPLISFRLGGQERHVTVVEFGRLLGLFTDDEADDDALMDGFLEDAALDSSRFGANKAWYELTGKRDHISTGPVKYIRDTTLRLVHKCLTYTFLHRSTEHDKCYPEDLWMLYMFSHRDPTRYINLPWTLAKYMAQRGSEQLASSKLVCGHWVTRIAKSLGLFTPANINQCSPPVKCKVITQRDLVRAEILTPVGNQLMDDGSPPHAPPPPRQPVLSQRDFMDQVIAGMHRLQFGQDQAARQRSQAQRRDEYIHDRYQPMWERMYQQHRQSMGDAGPSSPYAVPPYYYPEPYPGFPPPAYHPQPDEDMEED